ncbi:MAG TPA: TetR family transcriptional regulator [Microthrixaceae bacterium]|nr:TetR family transcriptional regulator [Microthrixaceae bacterium]
MLEEPVGLRERKKLQRRRDIEATALELFENDGFDGTTIESIAAAVGIAPRTFFYYFSTKEDVVLADYARRLERIVDEFAKRPDNESPWSSLRSSFLVVAADYEAEREQLIRRFSIMATNPAVFARSLQLQAGWEDALAAALEERLSVGSHPVVGSRLLASAALAAMRSSLNHWLATGFETPLPPLVEQCFDQLSIGLDSVGTVG